METPQAKAEEAPAAPLGKRSHLRKGTAAINQFIQISISTGRVSFPVFLTLKSCSAGRMDRVGEYR
ncbi:hypothetical protein FZC76_08710 [Sutcliffiella horikoshii]|uniref:Uncharacterized protein n=1 Tax=Sutcliffiella horikoshii TaxID=79883 RepID=A0A5D4T008_9BACI|nr:hypothetical protein FZC76_08710 [Sutcliffiella horikoshii]